MERKNNNIEKLNLKVAEAFQDDVGKGIVRIDNSLMQKISVRPGDIVEIQGERRTVAIADRAYPSDIGQRIIRMDGIIRRNAGTSIGEIVTVKKAVVNEAKKVIIAPSRKGLVVRASPEIFKYGLLGRAVVRGDIVSLGGSRRRRTTMSQSPFEEIFRMLDEDMTAFGFGDLKFIVADTNPKGPVIITNNTEIIFNPEAVEVSEEKQFDITYEDIGGLKEEIKKIREMVELPLKHPEIFEALGIEPPKGVLLHGPPGTGKTLLAKAVANETNSHFIVINGPEIMSKYYGQSEQNIRKKFEEAEKNAPSIIFIDEIDAIATKREETHGEVEKRVVAQLLAILDGLKSRGKVVVIAATNIPNALDPALRRPGRFDREIELGPPSKEGRLDILKIHTRYMPLEGSIHPSILKQKILTLLEKQKEKKEKETEEEVLDEKTIQDLKQHLENEKLIEEAAYKLQQYEEKKTQYKEESKEIKEIKKLLEQDPIYIFLKKILDENKLEEFIREIKNEGINKDLEKIASLTHGFVGADLNALAKEAAMIVLRRELPNINLQEDEPIPKEALERLKIRYQDFIEALKIVRPSAMREVLIDVPNVHWEDVAAVDYAKEELIEAVEWPLKYSHAFETMGIQPPKGILLYGPSGTGKTLLAKAVATESEANFISVKGPELLSKWVGESEKAVREIFKKARQNAPTIVFFDEFDAIAPRRGISENNVTERVVNQLLTEIDGLEEMNNVVVIAASNRPDMIDPSLLRPGRFDRLIHVKIPDEKGREEIIKVHTRKVPISKEVDIKEIATKTEGYTGADIESLVKEAAINALKRKFKETKTLKEIKGLKVTKEDFEKALQKVKPSVNKEIEQMYKDLENQLRKAKGEEMKTTSYFG